jgi:H+/Cl- antiporter ClcA
MSGIDGRRGGHKTTEVQQFPPLLIVFYCLPMVLIAVVLIAAGGTRLGLLIPAIAVGAMIGVMLFIGRLDRPRD